MKKTPSRLSFAIVGLLAGIAVRILADSVAPPLPPGFLKYGTVTTNRITLGWDLNPWADYEASVDTNGVPVPLVYRVRSSTNILTPLPWPEIGQTTTNRWTMTNVVFETRFFYVTASNAFFLESDPSKIVVLNASAPTGLKIHLEQ